MNNIKIYEEFTKTKSAEENIYNYRNYLNSIKKDDSFKWDINNDQIKVFLDITSYSHSTQTGFGKAIIGWSAFKDFISRKFTNTKDFRWEKVNHVGFIFKDGTVLHATTSGKGVQFEKYPDVINNPECYIIYNMGGNENTIKDLGKKLISEIKSNVPEKKCGKCGGSGKVNSKPCEKCGGSGDLPERYDMKGIVRQVLPDWINRIIIAEKDEYKFFCSELVSNLLVRSKTMTFDQLKSLHTNEELSQLSKYDEIDPTRLYKFIVEKGDLANLIKTSKEGDIKIIKPSLFID